MSQGTLSLDQALNSIAIVIVILNHKLRSISSHAHLMFMNCLSCARHSTAYLRIPSIIGLSVSFIISLYYIAIIYIYAQSLIVQSCTIGKEYVVAKFLK